MRLAEDLGAKGVTIPGSTVAGAVLDYARTHNVTKIIAGKPLRSRWHDWLRGAIVDQLIRSSGAIDIYVVSSEAPASSGQSRRVAPRRPWRRYLQSTLLVAAATLVSVPFSLLLSPVNLVMLYLVVVVVSAVFLGRGPSILGLGLERTGVRFLLRASASDLRRYGHRIHPDLHRPLPGGSGNQHARHPRP